MCAPAYIMTIRVPAMAKGAFCPDSPNTPATQIVRQRKKVPMNSVISLAFISDSSDMLHIVDWTSINVGRMGNRRWIYSTELFFLSNQSNLPSNTPDLLFRKLGSCE